MSIINGNHVSLRFVEAPPNALSSHRHTDSNGNVEPSASPCVTVLNTCAAHTDIKRVSVVPVDNSFAQHKGSPLMVDLAQIPATVPNPFLPTATLDCHDRKELTRSPAICRSQHLVRVTFHGPYSSARTHNHRHASSASQACSRLGRATQLILHCYAVSLRFGSIDLGARIATVHHCARPGSQMIFTQEQRYSQCRECTNTALSPGHRSPLRYDDLCVCW